MLIATLRWWIDYKKNPSRRKCTLVEGKNGPFWWQTKSGLRLVWKGVWNIGVLFLLWRPYSSKFSEWIDSHILRFKKTALRECIENATHPQISRDVVWNSDAHWFTLEWKRFPLKKLWCIFHLIGGTCTKIPPYVWE